ncbi:protein phosphatase 1 regulatory subunit 12A [Uranotaenia lowii]|uniref:protein phosphatase 1 regulatory subunit 12A n=1 Tax=Uranotaenia lowii TaxID=190385 RepID=UPI0024798956|nr:protein phosphatase 1 regulatory subunit 12A [Uranotaenia lowii]
MHNESTAQSTTMENPLPNNVPENTNRSPLHEAASKGDEKAVEALLASGADRNAKELLHGNTPLHEAAWKGYSRCTKILCSLPRVALKPPSGGLGATSKLPHLDLIMKDSSSKLKNVVQETKGALHSALLGARNFGGFSALHLAAQNGHNQSCREILLAGADPDVQNNYGDTPLHTACRYGHAGAIRILLSAKCDFERINLNGDTALHIACAMGRRKLTRILLEAGCKQDTKNAQSETPRDIAIRKNLLEIINILNTPVQITARTARERSSSSSNRHKDRDTQPKSADRSRSKEDYHRKSRDKSRGRSSSGPQDQRYDVDPRHWSPYGCHYFPDPRNFPSPKLETLPQEPLQKGEQYYLDLAGNIRKGPVGIGNTCYCAPFFKHLEQRMNQNRKSIRKYVNRATEKLDSRMTALAMKTDDQIEELTKTMIANRVQCENKRLHLEQWLKRGVLERSTGPHNPKTKKDEANTNTLTRCRSLELLDGTDDILSDRMKSSTPQFSRSIDFLDSQDHIPHHNHQQYSDRLDSSNNSNMKNHSETDDNSRRTPLRKFESPQHNGSKRSSSVSHSGRESYCYSDKDNDKEKPHVIYPDHRTGPDKGDKRSSGNSSGYDHKNEKIKVTERLEELLSKTKKILELEKIAKKKPNDNRYILALDRLKDIHHYESNPQVYHHQLSSKRDSPGHSYDIAHEMEKITQSLLPDAPVSPEISKDITTRKERSSNSQSSFQNQELVLAHSSTPHSTMSPNSSLLGGTRTAAKEVASESPNGMRSLLASTHFNGNLSELNSEHDDSDQERHVDSLNAPMINGFYANNCFEDIPSSSNTTIQSARNHRRKNEEFEQSEDQRHGDSAEEEDSEDEDEDEDANEENVDGDLNTDDKDWESDDQCDLSDMANLTQLKELKSRILNGTSWRSQVLQKSVQDVFQSAIEATEQTQENEIVQDNDEESPHDMSDHNRVKYIISKLQQSNIQQIDPPKVNQMLANDDNYSDSSEEEDDMECVDGPTPLDDRPITAKSLIEMYEKGLPKIENKPPMAAIRQQPLVPKDAYFHELPNKPKPPMKSPELTASLAQATPPENISLPVLARNRNPLPSYLNDNEIFNPSQSLNPPNHLASMPNQIHQSTPALYYPSQSPQFLNGANDYNMPPYSTQYVPRMPTQEKLLTSRKYINPSGSPFAFSGGSTGTPSPEFPYHMGGSLGQHPPIPHLHNHPPSHLHPTTSSTHLHFQKSQDNLSNDDSGYISAKVSEIHGPVNKTDNCGSPLLPLQTPSGILPMPRHFMPATSNTNYHLLAGHGAISARNTNSVAMNATGRMEGAAGVGNGSTVSIYDDQQQHLHYNLGASSLV